MPVANLLIATPVRGASSEAADVKLGWALTTRLLTRDPNVEFTVLGYGADLVRSRSRIVRIALEEKKYTHVLWWDDDIIPRDVHVIRYMLETGHDVVACPYPKKKVHWDRVTSTHAEREAYEYTVFFGGETKRQFINGCTEAEFVAMGFMLTSVGCLQKMWDAYLPTLSFGDVIDGEVHQTCGMFQLLLPEKPMGPLMSEDYSFCKRWRNIGGQVQVYLGPGSPVDHVGTHVYRGHREGVVQ